MVTASERLSKNPSYKGHFRLENKALHCKFCNHIIKHDRKSVIDNHITSPTHRKKKREVENGTESLQTTIPSIRKVRSEKSEINLQVVEVFTKADIPLEKIDKLKPFFQEYCRNGGAIVGSNQLRERYLPTVFESEKERLKSELINQKISVTLDETTDSCGRSVLNVLFSYHNKTKLVNTIFLERVNHTTIAQSFVNTITIYNISFNNLIFYISDNASYMKKAYTDILFPLIPNLFHNTCLAHSYNLIGETWIDYENFKLLDTVVKNIKASFVYSVARKRRWREHLALNSISLDNFSFDLEENAQNISITLPPLPVKTRWNSWFKFIVWLDGYFKYFITFYIQELRIDKSKAVKELVDIFEDPNKYFYVELLIKFISFNAQRLMLDLEFFKIRNLAVAPFVASRIDQTGAFLRNGVNNPPFSVEMSQLLSRNNYQNRDSFIPIFSEAFKLALTKFEKHTNNHSALPLFRATQCFNPQFIQSSTNYHDLNNYSLITEFRNPSNEIINEWAIYCGLSEIFEEGSLDLNQYWQEKKGTFPNLSKIAFIYIWLPISGVDVERSFSNYKRILEDRRRALSEKSIEMLNFLYYNNQ